MARYRYDDTDRFTTAYSRKEYIDKIQTNLLDALRHHYLVRLSKHHDLHTSERRWQRAIAAQLKELDAVLLHTTAFKGRFTAWKKAVEEQLKEDNVAVLRKWAVLHFAQVFPGRTKQEMEKLLSEKDDELWKTTEFIAAVSARPGVRALKP